MTSRKFYVLLSAGLGLLGGLTAAHIHVAARRPDYAGPLLPLDHLFELVLVLGLLVIGYGVGRLALDRAGLRFAEAIESLLFSLAIGLGILGTLILALGLAGALGRVSLGILLLLAAGAGRDPLAGLPRVLSEVGPELRARSADRLVLAFSLLVLAVVTVFLLIIAVAPPVDWDAQMYHLEVPYEFLVDGRIDLPLDNLHTAFVGLVHMLYLPLLAFGASSGPAVLSALVAPLLALTGFALAARLLDGQAGAIALALVWGTTTLLLVAITPRIDVTVAWYLLLGHYALLLTLQKEAPRRTLYLSAALLGMAFGVKYNAIPYIAALSPLVLWICIARWKSWLLAARAAVVFGLVLLGLALPWLLKNWLLMDAPLYPFLAERLLEPWLVPFYGTETVPSSLDPNLFRTLGLARQPFNVIDAFLSPEHLTIELEGRFYYANLAFVLLPLWVLYLRDRVVGWLIIPAGAYLLLILAPFGNTNLRYLIPAASPLAVAVAYMMVRTTRRFLSAGPARLLVVGLTALALLSSGRAIYTWLRHTQALPHLAGAASEAEYVAGYLDPSVRTLQPVIRLVDDRLPEDARILMLYEARALNFDRPVIQDTRAVNWPLIVRRLGPGDCLETAGVTHILIGLGSIRYYIQRGIDPETFHWQEFVDFANRCLGGEPIYQDGAFLLFRKSEKTQ